MGRPEIVARVRKLYRLAENAKKLGSRAEAETAWLTAERLKRKHKIAREELSTLSDDASTDELLIMCQGSEASEKWREILSLAITVHAGARGRIVWNKDGVATRVVCVNDGQGQRATSVFGAIVRTLAGQRRSAQYLEGAARGAAEELARIRERRPKGTAIVPARKPDVNALERVSPNAQGAAKIAKRPGYVPPVQVVTAPPPTMREIMDYDAGMIAGRALAHEIDRLLFFGGKR